MEWFCEKATEIGVHTISFLNCRYSERRQIRTERLEKILAGAMKQSEQATMPRLPAMTDFEEFVRQPFMGKKFIAHCSEEEKIEKRFLKQTYRPGENALVLIGPEGDFSREEIRLATAQGFEAITLGENRLRTETAALVACQTLHVLNQPPLFPLAGNAGE
jgi:16S rRNA (uracil1498-N3)-methyltransferase